MSGPQGDLYRRLLELEREVNRLRAAIDVQPARNPTAAEWRPWRLAVTATSPNDGTYPAEGTNPNTYWVNFVDADWTPKDAGSTTITKHERRAQAKVPARNMASGAGSYVPEGRLVLVVWNKGRNQEAGHWHFHYSVGSGGEPIRFRLTTSLSVFGSCNGMRQKWNGSDWVDDIDYPDTAVLFDYVGSASTGDPNDKCFAVEMADHPGVYEIVEIAQAGGIQIVEFYLAQEGGITEDDETADAEVIAAYGSDLAPTDPITVRNYPSHVPGKFAFRRPNGYSGVAIWNGTDWSIVDMEEQVKVASIYFTCAQTVTTSDASFDAEVTRVLGDGDLLGVAEEDTVEVFNHPDITDYVFTGSNLTSVGRAQWDHKLGQWDAVWITCPAE